MVDLAIPASPLEVKLCPEWQLSEPFFAMSSCMAEDATWESTPTQLSPPLLGHVPCLTPDPSSPQQGHHVFLFGSVCPACASCSLGNSSEEIPLGSTVCEHLTVATLC
jgi:hypothetical protein